MNLFSVAIGLAVALFVGCDVAGVNERTPLHENVSVPTPEFKVAKSKELIEKVDEVKVDTRAVSTRAQLASVRIDHPEGGYVGCGVVVAQSSTGFDVVTANHLLKESERFVIVAWRSTIDDGALVEQAYRSYEVMLRDPVRDLACLRVKDKLQPECTIKLASPDHHQSNEPFEAWVMRPNSGRPLEPELMKVMARQVARRSSEDMAVAYWRLEGKVERGMSGGALIDQAGLLIGIASGNSGGSAYYCDEIELRAFFENSGLLTESQ